jgi:hypothetical protein
MSWITKLEELYGSGSSCQFILHGNVHDVYWHAAEKRVSPGLKPPAAPGEAAAAAAVATAPGVSGAAVLAEYHDLDTFLVRRLLGGFSVIVELDLAHGIEVHRGREMLEGWDGIGALRDLRESPKQYLTALRRLFLFLNNLAVSEKRAVHVAAILRDAQLLVPGEGSNLYFDLGACATLVRDWSRPGAHAWFSLTTFLLAENLSDLHPIVRSNPLAAALEVSLPDDTELVDDIARLGAGFAGALGVYAGEPKLLAGKLRGLTRSALISLLRRRAHAKQPLDAAAVAALRKELVERECSSLVEFVESTNTLDDYHGQPQLVDAVRTDLKLMRDGVTRAVPMGYLVAGPVGTGKTYLVHCIAGEAGMPVIVLKNFRERWVGSSESNLEKIFRLIGAVGECLVFVDEADQTLGRRSGGGGDGSSDVSGRLYSMLAQFMGNTANRGRVIWVLATSRPDLVEVDLKRPGRIDRRLPVLPAIDPPERWGLLRGVFKRFGLDLPEACPPDLEPPEMLTAGAATALASAVFRQTHLLQKPVLDLLREQLANYVPPVPLARIREQIRLAIEDTSDLALLPESLRKEMS